MVPMFIFVLSVVALYFGGVGFVAVPIALGNSHWAARLSSLFGVSILAGLLPTTLGIQSEITIGLVLGGLLIAGGLSSQSDWVRLALTTLGIAFLFGSFAIIPWREVDMNWVVRGCIAIGMVSASMLLLRVLGYRMADLCPEQRTNDFVVGTGRNLDEWCERLDEVCGAKCERQLIIDTIRADGIDFTWAETIANAYERYRGLRVLPAAVGGPRLVAVGNQIGVPFWSGVGRNIACQFSIKQLMIWSTIAAALLAFTRFFASDFPTGDDLLYGVPLVLSLASTTFASAIAALALSRDRGTLIFCAAVVITTAILAPFLLHARGLVIGPVNILSLVIIYAAAMMYGGFTLARYRGYRILFVRSVQA